MCCYCFWLSALKTYCHLWFIIPIHSAAHHFSRSHSTQNDRLLTWQCHMSVRPSVCDAVLCIVDKRYILLQKRLNKWIESVFVREHDFTALKSLQPQTPYPQLFQTAVCSYAVQVEECTRYGAYITLMWQTRRSRDIVYTLLLADRKFSTQYDRLSHQQLGFLFLLIFLSVSPWTRSCPCLLWVNRVVLTACQYRKIRKPYYRRENRAMSL